MENKTSSPAEFFEKNGWIKIESFIDSNICNILYTYVTLEAERLNYLENNDIEKDEEIYGTFNDRQAPGDFSKYGDLIFDTLLIMGLEKISTLIEKNLIPTYSYHRLYTTGTELKKHTDRPSCEISTTLCLGYNVSNIDVKKYPDWDWPMFVKTKEGNELPIHLKPGDMIIYRGCEVEHWREPFEGLNHAQVFLHYNEKNGDYDNLYDDRPMLGLPSSFKNNLNKKIIS
jgi:hypothetical protein